jgi:hypothetical protein
MAAGELVMRCFHARTAAHVLHLKTRSYASHKALNDFYDEIVDFADSFAEAYQGDYGLIEDYPARYVVFDDAQTMLADLSSWIEKNRTNICDKDDTYLQNILDEIVALIRSTQYKLKFLK